MNPVCLQEMFKVEKGQLKVLMWDKDCRTEGTRPMKISGWMRHPDS